MVFYCRGVATMIEVKLPEEMQTPKQKEWEKKIRDAGFSYHIVSSLTEFEILIKTLIG